MFYVYYNCIFLKFHYNGNKSIILKLSTYNAPLELILLHIGNRIKIIRESLGIERKELCAEIVSYSHLSNIEAGKYVGSEDILIAIADRLKVNRDYFLKYNIDDPKMNVLLKQLKTMLDSDKIAEAEELVKQIENQYDPIYSLRQEFLFILLKIYTLLKIGQSPLALEFFDSHILPYIAEDNLPMESSEFQETYFYVSGSVYYLKRDFNKSYYSFSNQLPFLTDDFPRAKALYNMALSLSQLSDIQNAILQVEKSNHLFLKSHQWHYVANSENLLGTLYWKNKDYKNAEKYFLKTLELVRNFQFCDILPMLLHNLGLIYKKQSLSDKAIKYLYDSLTAHKKQNKNSFPTYKAIIDIKLRMNLLEEVSTILEEAKRMCRNAKDENQLVVFEARLALKLDNPLKYEKLMNRAIIYYYNNQLFEEISELGEELGDYYENIKKYKSASHYYHIALKSYRKEF